MNGITNLPQLTLTEALEEAWSKIVQVKGRSRRSEFWWTYLALIIINCVCSFIPFFGNLVKLMVYLAMIPLTFRRLHDTGRSGWWCGAGIILNAIFIVALFASVYRILLGNGFSTDVADYDTAIMILKMLFTPTLIIIYIVTFVYSIIMLIFLCQDSQAHENKYGPSPKYKVEEPEENIPENVPEWK